jgi:NLR family CARD domain-containing protein 3
MEAEHAKQDTEADQFSPPNNLSLVTTPTEEWQFVINPHEYTKLATMRERATLPRVAMTIEEAMAKPEAVAAKLSREEIIAARLYTGPMYVKYNSILRNPPPKGSPSYIYTIHAFASCIVKLSRVHVITTVYRGVKGGALPEAFLTPDKFGARGGVEYGFMSTTTEKEVAHEYMTAGRGDIESTSAALMYEIEEGTIDRGADVSWISQVRSYYCPWLLSINLTNRRVHSFIVSFQTSRRLFSRR